MNTFKYPSLAWGLCVVLLFAGGSYAQNSIHVYGPEIPWQSDSVVQEVGKIYRISTALAQAQAGDSLIIHAGIYRERIAISTNNLVITNYQDDYVLVTGAEKVENWTPASGMAPGVMQANVAGLGIQSDFSQLFVEGNAEMMARHPNNTLGKMMLPLEAGGGYSLLTSVSKDQGANANGYATFEQAIPNVDLTGGIFRGLTGKMRNYVFGDITAKSGNQVTFRAINNGQWKNDGQIGTSKHKAAWGFLLHKNLIDVPGEWFLEGQQLYYLPPADANLNELRTEVQVRDQVLRINNVQNLTLKGINFAAGHAEMLNSNQLSFEGCSWRYLMPFWTPTGYGDNASDDTGILIDNTSNTSFKDCYLGHSWGNGFAILDGSNHRFENCIIEDIAWLGIFASSIYTRTGPVTVQNCTFGDAGRFHLRMRTSDKMDVYDSDFYGAMMMGEDAGPIEATSTGSLTALNLQGSEFAYNKVHDCQGVPVFDGGYSKQFVVAFYMEDTENYTAHHNLVYNINSDNYTGTASREAAGAFLYLGPRYNYMNLPVNYYNNTVWNYDKSINIWHIEADNWQDLGMAESGGSMRDGDFVNNIFQEGASFKLNWTKQILNANGGRVDWVSVNNPPNINTNDFNAYVNHCATLNYNFNASHTVILNENDESQNFADAANGDFNLTSNSLAKGAGKVIPGITTTSNPDCGALEGGNRVLMAGATMDRPDFKEVEQFTTTQIAELPAAGQLTLYPNPTSDRVTLRSPVTFATGTKIEIYEINGQLLSSELVSTPSDELSLSVAALPQGVYVLKLMNGKQAEFVRFMKE